jgi:hypothetical protein
VEYLSIEQLTVPAADTASGMPEADVPQSGGAVRVRGLSRREILKAKDIDDRTAWEAFVIATGMLAPKMTVAQVEAWQGTALALTIEPIMDKIVELSGMDEGAERRAARELVEEDGAEFRDVPGGSTQVDPDATAGDATG